tara:strand:+ start:708 stop:1226 length:519 start_codon:yes stop_codon:yes gene_type:complete
MPRTQYETTSKYGMPIFAGDSTEDPSSIVPEGYSLDKAYQDQEPEDYLHQRTTSGAGKDGMTTRNSKLAYYKIEKPAGPPPEASAPTPEAEPKAETKPATPIEPSPEIQQAKERVKNYETSIDGSAGSNFNSDNVDYNNVNEEQAPNDEAAASFLDAKKTSLKDKMTFTPAT